MKKMRCKLIILIAMIIFVSSKVVGAEVTSEELMAQNREDVIKENKKKISATTNILTINRAGRVYGWGSNVNQESVIPDNLRNINQVESGWLYGAYSLALTTSGKVVAWGENTYGRCNVPQEALSGVTDIAAGGYHSAALKDGQVIMWGWNSGWNFQNVPASTTQGVIDIESTETCIAALKEDGTLVLWGDATNNLQNLPQEDQGSFKAISAGGYYFLALKDNGEVVAWGLDLSRGGVLNVPEEAKSNIVDISAGREHALALTADGEVIAWGLNTDGETNIPEEARSGVMAIEAGYHFSIAVKEDGELIIWGKNTDNVADAPENLIFELEPWPKKELNDFIDKMNKTLDPKVVATNNSKRIAASRNILAIDGYNRHAGKVVAWGANNNGQNDFPNYVDRGMIQVETSQWYEHSLGLAITGEVSSWGSKSYGQADVPRSVSYGVLDVAAGGVHSAAVSRDGEVVVWGFKQWGIGNVPEKAKSNVKEVEAGDDFVVALRNDGEVVAWGVTNFDQVAVPEKAKSGVFTISSGPHYSLALKENGEVIHWGISNHGLNNIPQEAKQGIIAIAAGESHSLALTRSGGVVAWGNNNKGQVNVPEEAKSKIVGIAAGKEVSVAIKDSGELIIWGSQSDNIQDIPEDLEIWVEPIFEDDYFFKEMNRDKIYRIIDGYKKKTGYDLDKFIRNNTVLYAMVNAWCDIYSEEEIESKMNQFEEMIGNFYGIESLRTPKNRAHTLKEFMMKFPGSKVQGIAVKGELGMYGAFQMLSKYPDVMHALLNTKRDLDVHEEKVSFFLEEIFTSVETNNLFNDLIETSTSLEDDLDTFIFEEYAHISKEKEIGLLKKGYETNDITKMNDAIITGESIDYLLDNEKVTELMQWLDQLDFQWGNLNGYVAYLKKHESIDVNDVLSIVNDLPEDYVNFFIIHDIRSYTIIDKFGVENPPVIKCIVGDLWAEAIPATSRVRFTNHHWRNLALEPREYKTLGAEEWSPLPDYSQLAEGEYVFRASMVFEGIDVKSVDFKFEVLSGMTLLNNYFDYINQDITFESLIDVKGGRGLFTSPNEDVSYDVYQLDHRVNDEELKEQFRQYLYWRYGEAKVNNAIFTINFLDGLSDDEVNSSINILEDGATLNKILEDYKKYKFLEIYLKRWLDIQIGDKNLANEFLYGDAEFIGFTKPRKEIILELMDLAGEIYQSDKTDKFFSNANALKYSANFSNVIELVEGFVSRESGDVDFDQWFKEYYKGTIAEYKNGPYSTYSFVKFNKNAYLPILTVKSKSNALVTTKFLMIFTTTDRYNEEQLIEKVAKIHYTAIATLSRIAPVYEERITESYDKGNRLFAYGNDASDDFTLQTNRLIQEVYAPTFYSKYANPAGAYGGKHGIYYCYDAWEMGRGVIQHEFLGHTAEFNGFLGYFGNGWRMQAEEITTFMTGKDRINQNFTDDNLVNTNPDLRINRSFNRFQTEDDWRDFYRSIWRSRYLIDVAWANVMIENPDLQRGKLAKYKDFKYYKLTDEQISNLDLSTLDDFVNEGIKVVGRESALNQKIESYNANFHANGARFNIDYNAWYQSPRIARIQNVLYRYGWAAVGEYMGHEKRTDDEVFQAVYGKGLNGWYIEEYKAVETMAKANDIGGLTFSEWKNLIKNLDDPTVLKLIFERYAFNQSNEGRIPLEEISWNRQEFLDEISHLYTDINAVLQQ